MSETTFTYHVTRETWAIMQQRERAAKWASRTPLALVGALLSAAQGGRPAQWGLVGAIAALCVGCEVWYRRRDADFKRALAPTEAPDADA